MLEGCELNHLILIDKYFMHKFPELKRLQSLLGLDNIFSGAIQQLKSVDASEALHVKILYPKDDTSQLNRNRFEMYAAATACAQFENSIFLNYYTTDNEARVKLMSDSIKRYLNLRQKLSVIAVGDYSAENIRENGKKQFLCKAIDDFEKGEISKEEQSETLMVYRSCNLTQGIFSLASLGSHRLDFHRVDDLTVKRTERLNTKQRLRGLHD